MKYLKLINNPGNIWKSFVIDNIYPDNYVVNDELLSYWYKGQEHYWKEVSKKEYLQQELNNGKLVKGAYYQNDGYVFWKYNGTDQSEYYLNARRGIFCTNGGNFSTDNSCRSYNLASDEEIEWLEACNKANKFITKEEFIKNKKWILPEKWVLKNPENEESKIIYDYFNSLEGTIEGRFPYSSGTYFHYPNYANDCITSTKKQSDYTEITFEQFKKYVIKENMEEKKLIGYKLIKPEYEAAAAKLIYNGDKIHGLIQVYSEWNILKEAGVLDIWFEPLYEPIFPDININGYKCVFHNGHVEFGCAKIDKDLFIDLENLGGGIGNRTIQTVTIGSGTFNNKQIKEIADYYNNK